MPPEVQPPPPAPARSCIVVGGGVAGLACAHALDKAQVRTTVLEASNRLGGRVWTSALEGIGPAEMGATWLHGTEGNVAYALAQEIGALEPREGAAPAIQSARPRAARWLRDDGAPVDESAVGAVQHAFHEALSDCEDGRAAGQAQAAGLKDSLGGYLRHAWTEARAELVDLHGDAQLLDAAWAWAEALQCAVDGCGDLGQQGLACYANYEELDGPHLTVPAGMSALPGALAAPLMDKGAVSLGTEVVRIRWGPAPGVVVECRDGTAHTADAAVLAVPLPALKGLQLDPPLPAKNAAAAAALEVGCVEKVFISVEPGPGAGGPGPGVGPGAADGAVAGNQDGPWAPPSAELLWTSGKRPEGWAGQLFALAAGEGGVGGGTLVGWLTGDAARAVARRSEVELLEDARRDLAWVWEALGWRPVRCQSTAWSAHPFIRGSYSYPRPGAPPTAAADLATPLEAGGTPRVLLCGEATSQHHFGTVHGAMASGVREASRLLRHWRIAAPGKGPRGA